MGVLGAPPVVFPAAGEGAMVLLVRSVLGVVGVELFLAVGEFLFGVGGKE